MKFAKLAVGICLTLAVAGCADAPDLVSAPVAQAGEAPSVRKGGVAEASPHTAFGAQHVWTTGLSITIAQPKSLQPSSTAFPQAPRMAVFSVTITNGSKTEYRPTQLSIRALSNGRSAQEVIDSVQGLNGIATAVRELPPGRDTTFTLAFVAPEEPVLMRLVVEPNGAGQEPSATFEGQA
ncbi:hypothetical protein [Umezawaea sp.]|uniref:hypothetical protein n=1 Tax=Umezawaea sp. TaxID=1955258 RepID=UPI002ED3A3C6